MQRPRTTRRPRLMTPDGDILMRPLARLAPLAAALALAAAAHAGTPGQPAPDFTVNDAAGKPVKLSDFRGKFVVLEWTNPECPFVRKHYDSANMQGLQKQYAREGRRVAVDQLDQPQPRASSRPGRRWPSGWASRAARRRPCSSTTPAPPDAPTPRAPRRTCSSSIPPGKVVYAGAIDDKRSRESRRCQDREELRARRARRVARGQAGHASRARRPTAAASSTSGGA